MKIIIVLLIFFCEILFYRNEVHASIYHNHSVSATKTENDIDTLSVNRLHYNNVFIEIFGNSRSPFPCLNYERLIFNKKEFHLSVRIGGSFIFFKTNDERSATTTFLINGINHINKNLFFELGIGLTMLYDRIVYNYPYNQIDKSYELWGTALAGIRLQGKKCFFYRIGFTPVFSLNKIKSFWPLGGISFGFSFK